MQRSRTAPARRIRQQPAMGYCPLSSATNGLMSSKPTEPLPLISARLMSQFGYVARGANELYPALEGLMIRTSANESGKKRVVNVDDAQRRAS